MEVSPGRLQLRSTVLLTAGVALLLVGLGTGSQNATPIWPVAALALMVLVMFVVLEWRSSNPTVPLRLLRHRVIGPAILVSAISGTLMFGVTSYVPLWVQSVQGGSAYAAGVAVGAMSIGWPITSAISGFVMVRLGYQRLVVAGAMALLAGSSMLAAAPASIGAWWTAAATLVIGIGMGAFSAPLLIVIQSSVQWGRRGAATALNQLSRTIGGAIGVSVMGVVLEHYVAAAGNPLHAREQLRAGLHADFALLVILAMGVLATGVAVLLASPRQAARDDRPAQDYAPSSQVQGSTDS